MSVFFVYVDDSGAYRDRNAPEKQTDRNPFYVRAAFMIPAERFWELREAVLGAQRRLPISLPDGDEVKWSDIHQARGALNRDGEIRTGKDYSYLRGCSAKDLESYPETLLRNVGCIDGCKVVVTVSRSGTTAHKGTHIIRWHFQGLMQRVQFDLKPKGSTSNHLGVLVSDEESKRHGLSQAELAQFYQQLRLDGDPYNDYPNLNDSLFFVDSKHSAGVQVADVIAGCCNGALRGQTLSLTLWHDHVRPIVREHPTDGRIKQMGVVAIPNPAALGTSLDPIL